MNHRQHHFNLLALLSQSLDHFRAGLHLPGQGFDQAGHLSRGTAAFIRGLANVHNLLQGRLHYLTFVLRLISHGRQGTQAFGHFITLQLGRRIGAGIVLGHDTDFDARTLCHFTGFANNRL